jgi:hypothetical protein
MPLAVVLALLSAAPGSFDTTALSVDVSFHCATRTTQSLVLTPEAHALLQVPEGCPDAGRAWRLMLRCEGERCTGAVLAERGSIARVHGKPARLQVTPLASEHPATLERLRVRVTSQQPLHVEAEDRRERPLQLSFRAPTFAVSYALDTVVATGVRSPRLESDARLVLQALRTDPDHARVRIWNEREELLVDRALRLGEPVALDCARSAGWCTGKTELTVREAHPR